MIVSDNYVYGPTENSAAWWCFLASAAAASAGDGDYVLVKGVTFSNNHIFMSLGFYVGILLWYICH